MNIRKITLFLGLFGLFFSENAYSLWYRRVPVVVYQEPSPADSVAAGVMALGACVGMGIAGIVEHKAKKRRYKEYINTFKDMGYTREQATIYAKMAMSNPEGLQAVMRSIDQEKLAQLQMIAKQDVIKVSHDQKLQEMSHEYKLKLMTYLVMLLSLVILFGLGCLLYRLRKNK